MNNFVMSRIPHLFFGVGTFLPSCENLLSHHGVKRLSIISGRSSFRASEAWNRLQALFEQMKIDWNVFTVDGEPSVHFVDATRNELVPFRPHAILAIGGGSVLDAGKAVSAMLHEEGSVKEFLEGVGSESPSGRKTPVFAVPTTAGTGSEATKNAVISQVGREGFKKSLRHDNFIPDAAIIDASLARGCPNEVTAASGLDAVTQLLEAYVSPKASIVTDAYAESGLAQAGRSFIRAYSDGADLEARSGMAYAAYASGVCLANAGLGIVHAIASPLGALKSIPHGIVCGTLLAVSVKRTVGKLGGMGAAGLGTLLKYANAGVLLSGKDAGSTEGNIAALVELLETWTRKTAIPRLGSFGLTEDEAVLTAGRTSGKQHPVPFSTGEIAALISERL